MVAPDVLALQALSRKYQVNVQVLSDRLTAVVRGEVATGRLPEWLTDAFDAVRQYLNRVGVPIAGPPFARFAALGDAVAVEAGFPVGTQVPGDGHVEPSILDSCCAAVTMHWGPREHTSQAHDAVRTWLARQGCLPAGPQWEVYYLDSDVEPDQRRWHIEVVVPYRLGEAACVPASRPCG